MTIALPTRPELTAAELLAVAQDVAENGILSRRHHSGEHWGGFSVGPRSFYVAERAEWRLERDPASGNIHLFRNGRHAHGWDALHGRGLRLWWALQQRFLNLETPSLIRRA